MQSSNASTDSTISKDAFHKPLALPPIAAVCTNLACVCTSTSFVEEVVVCEVTNETVRFSPVTPPNFEEKKFSSSLFFFLAHMHFIPFFFFFYKRPMLSDSSNALSMAGLDQP